MSQYDRFSTNKGACASGTWSENATTVADGNGQGSGLSQLNCPFELFVDQTQSIYIDDSADYRVLTVDSITKNVSIVAGGSPGGNLTKLS